MIRYKPNPEKVLEAVLWLANQRPGMDMYRILKVLFLADKWHLNTYGRPIAGERYVAMEHGPVAETAYNILKRRAPIKRRLNISEFPFNMETDEQGREILVMPSRQPNEGQLSKSDVKTLKKTLDSYGDMSFNALKALTHRHRSYENAWAQRGDKRSVPMRYEDLLEGENDDPEVVEELEYISQFRRR